MKLENFVQKYGNPVFMYKEFLECKLQTNSLTYEHQEFLKRYFGNIFLNSNEILLFHEMGVGKTCTSIKIAEHLLENYPSEYKGVLVLSRGQGLLYNFMNEIAFKCTNNKYLDEKKEMNDKLFRYRIKKNILKNYNFFTFEIFSKILKDLSDAKILSRFNSYIIILDEVHNIRDLEYKNNFIYKQIHRFLHCLNHRKIILMTGTPMKDNPDEIASIMNLILPLENQMNVNSFNTTFFKGGELVNVEKLKSYFAGRISFLKSTTSTVPKIFIGNIVAPLEHFTVIPLLMHDFQNEGYEKAWRSDIEHISIYSNSRQASLFIDPAQNFGKKINFNEFHLPSLKNYSCKYHYLLEKLNETANELSIVYADFVKGSGIHTLAKILQYAGYTNEINNPKAFIVLTSKMSEIRKQYLIDVFNSKENVFGEKIQILIGSRVIMEGYTFQNVQHEHILTPHWNYSETSQVIARGWRNSHSELIARGVVNPVLKIYQYVAIPRNFPSIDMMMYKTSEQKDLQISKVIQTIKECAFDCYLFKKRNELGQDYSRECQYRPCNFKCDHVPSENSQLITTNYDIQYYSFSKQWYDDILHIKSLFSKKFCYIWSEFRMLTQSITDLQLIKLILFLNKRYISIVNPLGNLSHLQYDNIGVFLTVPYQLNACFYDSVLCHYEMFRYKKFHRIVESRYWLNIQNIIRDFVYNENDRWNIITHMPEEIQHILLRNALKSKSSDMSCISFILQHFETSIYQNGFDVGYFLNDTYWCYNLQTMSETDTKKVEKYFKDQKMKLETNGLGFYGQHNRNLDEFCIKVLESGGFLDKRKIHSGRRCVNWNKVDLIHLLDKMKIQTTVDQSRKSLCDMIKTRLKELKLLESNTTCGTQFKRKEIII